MSKSQLAKWASEANSVKLADLSPDSRQLAALFSGAFLELEENIQQALETGAINSARFEETLSRHAQILENIPRDLVHNSAEKDFVMLLSRVELMWSIGKWLAGGVGAGITGLIGYVLATVLKIV